jgi:hypothetical protein
MSECSICCETFNKSSRCPIECKTCEDKNMKACQTCCKKYILDSINDPKCMVCSVEWDQEFLSDNFTKSFISKELKEHKENVLFEKQIARLSENQQDAQNFLLVEQLKKQKNIINDKISELQTLIRKLNYDVRNIDISINDIINTNTNTKRENNFMYKCPLEDCNGFLNKQYVCGICDNKICKHCFEKITDDNEDEHECDDDKKKTVEMLKKDTKPCPKCAEMIHKTEGCDQMYCIKCHSAFSWRTGEIETRHIHNPEYFRYLRENGEFIPRNPGDIPHNGCNELPNYRALIGLCRTFYPTTYETRTHKHIDHKNTIIISNMYRMKTHILHIRRIRNNELQLFENNLKQLRVLYILNRIDKNTFKRKIQMIYKKYDKDQKVLNVWNLIDIVLNEYLGKISEISPQNIPRIQGINIIEDIILQSNKTIDFCNKAFKKIGISYNVVYGGITNDWIEIPNYQTYLKIKANNKQ